MESFSIGFRFRFAVTAVVAFFGAGTGGGESGNVFHAVSVGGRTFMASGRKLRKSAKRSGASLKSFCT